MGMNKTKRLLHLVGAALFGAALLAGMVPHTAFAASSALWLSPATKSVQIGDTFPIEVRLNTGGDEITSVQIDLVYDRTALEFVSSTQSGSPYQFAIVEDSGDAKRISVAVMPTSTGANGATGSNELATTATFKALKGSGTYPITLKDTTKVLRKDNTESPVTRTGGSYTLTAPPETTKPTVSITAPVNGQTVSNTVSITANASDNVGVTRVDFYRGTSRIFQDSSAPYSYAWDTKSVSNGGYQLTARAYDAAGNEQTSSAVNVTVSNATTNPPPSNPTPTPTPQPTTSAPTPKPGTAVPSAPAPNTEVAPPAGSPPPADDGALVGTPTLGEVEYTKATITWQTSHPTKAYVRYGVDNKLTWNTPVSELVSEHTAVLSPKTLAPGTTYTYQVILVSSDGTESTAATRVFTTRGFLLKVSLRGLGGKPLKQADVELNSEPMFGKTDDNGYIEFMDVAPGKHTLKVTVNDQEYTQELSVASAVTEVDGKQFAAPQEFQFDIPLAQASAGALGAFKVLAYGLLGFVLIGAAAFAASLIIKKRRQLPAAAPYNEPGVTNSYAPTGSIAGTYTNGYASGMTPQQPVNGGTYAQPNYPAAYQQQQPLPQKPQLPAEPKPTVIPVQDASQNEPGYPVQNGQMPGQVITPPAQPSGQTDQTRLQ